MRSKLSLYSVALLVGLAVVSAVVFTVNPFNGAPASGSPAAQGTVSTTTGSSAANGSGSLISNSSAGSSPFSNFFGQPPGGDFDSDHNHSGGFPGIGGNSTTTTSATIYSQNE